MADKLIKLTGVTAGYDGQAVVRDINLDIVSDDFVGMIGPNGGGKSTVLKTILGIIRPLSGTIERAPGLRIGYLPQVVDVDRHFPISVLDVVLSGQQGRGRLRPSRSDRANAMELLDYVGLAARAGDLIGELSGGQRQG